MSINLNSNLTAPPGFTENSFIEEVTFQDLSDVQQSVISRILSESPSFDDQKSDPIQTSLEGIFRYDLMSDVAFLEIFAKATSFSDRKGILKDLIRGHSDHFLELTQLQQESESRKFALLKELIDESYSENEIKAYFDKFCLQLPAESKAIESNCLIDQDWIKKLPQGSLVREYLKEWKLIDKKDELQIDFSVIESMEVLKESLKILRGIIGGIEENLDVSLVTYLYERFNKTLNNLPSIYDNNRMITELRKISPKKNIMEKIKSFRNILETAPKGTPCKEVLKKALDLPILKEIEEVFGPSWDKSLSFKENLRVRVGNSMMSFQEHKDMQTRAISLKENLISLNSHPLYIDLLEKACLHSHLATFDWLEETILYQNNLNVESFSDFRKSLEEQKLSNSEKLQKSKDYILSLKQEPVLEIMAEKDIFADFQKCSFSEKIKLLCETEHFSELLKKAKEDEDLDSLFAFYECILKGALPENRDFNTIISFFSKNCFESRKPFLESELLLKAQLEIWVPDRSYFTPFDNFLMNTESTSENFEIMHRFSKLKEVISLFLFYLQREAFRLNIDLNEDGKSSINIKEISLKSDDILYDKFYKKLDFLLKKYENDEFLFDLIEKIKKIQGEHRSEEITQLTCSSFYDIAGKKPREMAKDAIDLMDQLFLVDVSNNLFKDATGPFAQFLSRSELFNYKFERNPKRALWQQKMVNSFVGIIKKELENTKESDKNVKQLDEALENHDFKTISLITQHICCLKYFEALEQLNEDYKSKKLKTSFFQFSPTPYFSIEQAKKMHQEVENSKLSIKDKSSLLDILSGDFLISNFEKSQENKINWFKANHFEPCCQVRGIVGQEIAIDQAFDRLYFSLHRGMEYLKMSPVYFELFERAFIAEDLDFITWISQEIRYQTYLNAFNLYKQKGIQLDLLSQLEEKLRGKSITEKIEVTRSLLNSRKDSLIFSFLLSRLDTLPNHEFPIVSEAQYEQILAYLNDSLKNNPKDVPFFNFLQSKNLSLSFCDFHEASLIVKEYDHFISNAKNIVNCSNKFDPLKKQFFLKLLDLNSFDLFQLDQILQLIHADEVEHRGDFEIACFVESLPKVTEILLESFYEESNMENFIDLLKKIKNPAFLLDVLNDFYNKGEYSIISALIQFGGVWFKIKSDQFLKDVILRIKNDDDRLELLKLFLTSYLHYNKESVSKLISYNLEEEGFLAQEIAWVQGAAESSPLRYFLEKEGFFKQGELVFGCSPTHSLESIDDYFVMVLFTLLKRSVHFSEFQGRFTQAVDSRNLEEFNQIILEISHKEYLGEIKGTNEEEIQKKLVDSSNLNLYFWKEILPEGSALKVFLEKAGVLEIKSLSKAMNYIVLMELIESWTQSLEQKMQDFSHKFQKVDLRSFLESGDFLQVSSVADQIIYFEYENSLVELGIESPVFQNQQTMIEKIAEAKRFVENHKGISLNYKKKLLDTLNGNAFSVSIETKLEILSKQVEDSSLKNVFLSLGWHPDLALYKKQATIKAGLNHIAENLKKDIESLKMDRIYLEILDFSYMNKNLKYIQWIFKEVYLSKKLKSEKRAI